MSSKINIIEVGIRDGLQVVDKFIPTEQKLDFINGFIDSGIKNIQVTSFVNPKKVPQTSDAEDLVKKLPVVNDVEYSALIFNQRGIERAIESGIKKVETSISLSSIYSKKNLGIGIDESIDKLKHLIKFASKNDMDIRAGLQCVWGCPYDGKVDHSIIIKKLSEIVEMLPSRISLCDTSGMATPNEISALLELINKTFPKIHLSLHLHNTYGIGLVNLFHALQFEIKEIDTSFGGIGGSPYISRSKGNIATEDTIYMLEKMGYGTGINIKKIAKLSKTLNNIIGPSYFSGQIYKILG